MVGGYRSSSDMAHSMMMAWKLLHAGRGAAGVSGAELYAHHNFRTQNQFGGSYKDFVKVESRRYASARMNIVVDRVLDALPVPPPIPAPIVNGAEGLTEILSNYGVEEDSQPPKPAPIVNGADGLTEIFSNYGVEEDSQPPMPAPIVNGPDGLTEILFNCGVEEDSQLATSSSLYLDGLDHLEIYIGNEPEGASDFPPYQLRSCT
uniref:Uncharacterized protein n=1 Tax=Physcomitrium patens TaxID=3218 RepID=A0A2K1L2J3_PHYPA|nr:hypothetical protein PHYPA_003038 [Physcomitrium patens]